MTKRKTGFERRATIDDVNFAYRLFLRRNPDDEGLRGFTTAVKAGISIDDLVDAFFESQEFLDLRGMQSRLEEVEIDGRVILARSSDTSIGSVILREREYEPHVTAVLKRHLGQGQTFVDIGANIGFFTSLGAKLVGNQGKVIAVEPNPENVQVLLACLVRNRSKNVEVLPFAASDARSIHSLTIGGSNAFLTAAREPGSSAAYAQSIMLDQHLATEDRIDVVKIDVEGFEVRAIRGFKTLLRKFRPTIVSEFHPKALREIGDSDPEEYLSELFEIHSTIHVITRDGRLVRCSGARKIMGLWRKVNQSHGTEDAHHLDLVATSS